MISLGRMSRPPLACLLAALCLGCGHVEPSTIASGPTEAREAGSASQDAPDQTRIRRLIANLSKEDQSEQAQNELLEIAKRSTINRNRVIQDLIADVSTHEELNKQRFILSASFDYWDRTTRIFRLLEATEAIDVMIQCIHCGNGLTGSFNVQPAFDVLHAMGALAVPKLSKALREHPHSVVRSFVALCLGDIGGAESKEVLQQALQTETDKEVIRYISLGLSTIANNPSRPE